MSRYAIWNKKDPVITPVGEILTAEQWIERWPVAGIDSITVVCAGGEINGSFFGTLGQMVDMFKQQGCDFSACVTDQEKLNVIEEFEDARDRAALEASGVPSTDERIAAALEAQVMMSLPDDVEI